MAICQEYDPSFNKINAFQEKERSIKSSVFYPGK